MSNTVAIVREELQTDPEGRNYAGMSDQQAADDMNQTRYNAPAEARAFVKYLATNKARDATSETPSVIYGRLKRVDEIGTDAAYATSEAAEKRTFYGGTGDPNDFSTLNGERLDACRTLLMIADGDMLSEFNLKTTEVTLSDLLDSAIAAGVMKSGDKTAIIALSENRASRGMIIGAGFVKEVHVREARG